MLTNDSSMEAFRGGDGGGDGGVDVRSLYNTKKEELVGWMLDGYSAVYDTWKLVEL